MNLSVQRNKTNVVQIKSSVQLVLKQFYNDHSGLSFVHVKIYFIIGKRKVVFKNLINAHKFEPPFGNSLMALNS